MGLFTTSERGDTVVFFHLASCDIRSAVALVSISHSHVGADAQSDRLPQCLFVLVLLPFCCMSLSELRLGHNDPKYLGSAGVLPALQTFLCRWNNTCHNYSSTDKPLDPGTMYVAVLPSARHRRRRRVSSYAIDCGRA